MTRTEAEDFLYREARLLDDRRFEEWLTLFADDARYWMPPTEETDPLHETSIVYDDHATLTDRVERLRSPAAHSQAPPSRTRHFITNVEVEAADDETVTVYSNLIVYEARVGQERSYAASCQHRLRLQDGAWLITLKKVVLVNGDSPLYNLTFLI
jgi:3-phenylpropionate/cinnamic acid dioxygenase small subunit